MSGESEFRAEGAVYTSMGCSTMERKDRQLKG